MTPPVVTVSDHALVRYLERAKRHDFSTVRAEMAEAVRAAVALGAPKISAKGVTFILDGAHVVTILPGASPQAAFRNGARHNGTPLHKFQRPEGRR